jgi:hypothetical protein
MAHTKILTPSALLINYRNRQKGIDRHYSFVPLVGGVLTAVGLYLLSLETLSLAIAVIDPGVSILSLLPVALWRQRGNQPK